MVGAQRQRAAMSPHGLCGSAQILEPGKGPTLMRVFAKRGDESVSIIADEQRHLRVGKNTPHGTRQVLVTHLRKPAPPGVINRHRQAGLEHGVPLLREGAAGKVDGPKFGGYDGECLAAGINPGRSQ
jgi:hypothetical protein